MSWQDQMQKASFKGVGFHVDNQERSGGLNGVHHTFTARDTGLVEYLGKKDDQFSIQAVLLGDDCFQQRDALVKKLLEPEPGELVHPWYGRMTVNVAPGNSFRISGKGIEGGIVRITMNFIRSSADTGPTYKKNTAADLKASTSNLRDAARENFTDKLQITKQPGFVLDELVEDLSKLETVTEEVAAINNIQKVYDLATEAIGTASNVADKLESLTRFVGSSERILKALTVVPANFEKLLTAIPNSTGIMATLPRQAQALNRDLTRVFNLVSTASTFAETAIDAEFSSFDDAITTMNQGLDLLDQAIHLNQDDPTYFFLEDTRAKLAIHIKSTSGDLSRVVKVSHAFTQPAILRAYDLYEDLDREEEILTRNNVKHPNKLHPSEPLEVLSV